MDPRSALPTVSPRRHNPVESICRKLQTIQWCGDREPNSPFQIPKIPSSSYHPAAPRPELDPVLRKRPSAGPTPQRDHGRRGAGTATGIPTLASRASHPPPPPPDGAPGPLGGRRPPPAGTPCGWQRYCSTPTALGARDPATCLTFSRASAQLTQLEERQGSPLLDLAAARRPPPGDGPSSRGLTDFSGELPFSALVVRRLSMGEAACPGGSDSRKENVTEVSLICEEDLLDTIFHACDTQRRGRVYVSCIVDYLRHTTSRTSEDSGLEELCTMLDPERRDVSIDLDTYHAIMKEWIDDRRANSEDLTEDLNQDPMKCIDALSAKRSILLNMTSGSLEAFGGEASRVELETSELMYCMADLQMSKQHLQEEMKTLKQTAELMEESNQRLAEENQELRSQARASQQLAQKEKMLKEEVEEMRVTLSAAVERQAQAYAHDKHMERENQSLMARISCLEEENFKVTTEMDDLQGRMGRLCDLNADLQVQIHSFDAVLAEKEHLILEKSGQMEELKKVVEEYSSVIELLRADKTKLETQMHVYPPDMSGLSLSVAYRLNQSSRSLQTELALAQSPLEGASGTTLLDETLDKEVLLLLQGPNPEHMAQEFRGLLSRLKTEFRAEAGSVLSAVRRLSDPQQTPEGSTEPWLQAVQGELEARRADWALGLDQLAQYADSLEKELIKMAGNMRRSRTEILHLSVRVQEQENQKRQLGEELEQLRSPQDSREASCQAGAELEWDAEFDLQGAKQAVAAMETVSATTSPPEGEEVEEEEEEEDAGEERWTVVEDLGGGEEPRDTSTPLPPSEEPEPGSATDRETLVFSGSMDSEAGSTSHLLQAAGECAGQEASGTLSAALHSHTDSAEWPLPPLAGSNHEHQVSQPDMDQTLAPGNTPPETTETVPPNHTPSSPSSSSGQEAIVKNGSPERGGDPCGGGGGGGGGGDATSSDMSAAKSPARLGERGELADSSGLLPVVMEEEEGSTQTVSGPATGPDAPPAGKVSPDAAAKVQSGPDGGDPPSPPSPPSDSSQSKERRPDAEGSPQDPPAAQTTGTAGEKEETSVIADSTAPAKEEVKGSQSPTDKEIEVEFQRLSLGFKCDLFTLDKRLRLEERSRDLAEENVRKEISSCQGLLQALIPLCDDDNQSMEIIGRLQKNLEILVQSMTRVSSRSEMLGAIHQENRIGKAVEVMFQHVENLKRMYTKEHTELVELRQTIMQNERSFGSQTDKADFRGKPQSSSQYYGNKQSGRRVSIAAIPRSPGFDPSKPQDMSESEMERLTRRSPWNVLGKSGLRPPLKRFISSGSWADPSESGLAMNGASFSDSNWEQEVRDPPVEKRRSSLTELGMKLTSFILPIKTPSTSSVPTSSDPLVSPSVTQALPSIPKVVAPVVGVVRGGRGLWLWLAMVVVLAGLLALLASLVMQPAVDAAPVGTGDSWMTIQQLLWPYTGLRHNGQPPV